jgi:hypothetical protein
MQKLRTRTAFCLTRYAVRRNRLTPKTAREYETLQQTIHLRTGSQTLTLEWRAVMRLILGNQGSRPGLLLVFFTLPKKILRIIVL